MLFRSLIEMAPVLCGIACACGAMLFLQGIAAIALRGSAWPPFEIRNIAEEVSIHNQKELQKLLGFRR